MAKKIIRVSAIVIAFVATGSVVAAEQIVYPEPQSVSDVQSTPADKSLAATSPETGPYCEAGCEPGCEAVTCDCCEVPRFAASVDALFLQRQRPTDTVLFSGPGGATLLDASQFNFGYQAGIDANLTYNPNCDHGIDFRYEWLGDSIARASFAVPIGTSQYNTTPPTFFSGGAAGGLGRFDYDSALQTAEVNLHKHFYWFDGLIGFRYANLSERLNGAYTFNPLAFNGSAATETDTWTAHNNLYGLQIGADALLWENCSRQFRIDGYGKAGIYDNLEDTHLVSLVANAPGGGTAFANASLAHAAFLGELGLTTSWQLTCHVALRAGYQMLWLDGVATAGKQVPATGNFNPNGPATSHVDSASTVFYQGFNTGVELTW